MNHKYVAIVLHVDTHHRFNAMHANTEDYTVITIAGPSKLLLPAEFPLSLIHHLHDEDEPGKCN
jgi:hypothetical protein